MRELRRTTFPVRVADNGADTGGQGTVVQGHAAVFNSQVQIIPGFNEVIRPGAFDAALRGKPSVPILYNHSDDFVIGRTPRTASLRQDDIGLRFTATLPRNSHGAYIEDAVRRGDLCACSFSMSDVTDTWTAIDAKTALRSITGIGRLWDCSIVLWPAYAATDVGIANSGRSADAGRPEVADVQPPRRAAPQASGILPAEHGPRFLTAEEVRRQGNRISKYESVPSLCGSFVEYLRPEHVPWPSGI